MSDILIKGLQMPKDDILRIEICPNGQVNRIIGWAISEQNRGTAIELPLHGALVDRDEELYQIAMSMFPQDMDTTRVLARYKKWLKSAPVVLEANDE